MIDRLAWTAIALGILAVILFAVALGWAVLDCA